ncbi:MAG: DUF2079 domain-containing protein [Chloroflexota bacterium]
MISSVRHGRPDLLNPTRCRLLLAAATAAYIAGLLTLSILKHATYHSSLIDLGIFDQVIWNTAHGRWFWDTLDPFVQQNHVFLGQHFSPGLAAIVPLYWIAPSVYTLFVVQTFALALGCVPIYVLAARRFADERIALLLSLAYLAMPSLAYANLFDFHEIVLAVPLLAWAAERLDADRPGAAVALLCIALLFKEEVGLIVAAFGVFAAFGRGRPKLGAALIVLGLGWIVGIVYVAVPHIRGGPYLFTSRYQGGILEQGRINLDYLAHFWNAAKLKYFALLIVPLLGLPLIGGWAVVLIIPTTLYTILSTYPLQYDYHYHYAAPLLPLLFVGAIHGLLRFRPSLRLPISATVFILVLAAAWLVGPLPGAREWTPAQYEWGPRERAMATLAAMVPAGDSLAVDNQMGAHLTERVWVTHFFTGYEQAQALLFDLRETSATETKRQRAVAAIEHDPRWRLVAKQDDIVLYLRR